MFPPHLVMLFIISLWSHLMSTHPGESRGISAQRYCSLVSNRCIESSAMWMEPWIYMYILKFQLVLQDLKIRAGKFYFLQLLHLHFVLSFQTRFSCDFYFICFNWIFCTRLAKVWRRAPVPIQPRDHLFQFPSCVKTVICHKLPRKKNSCDCLVWSKRYFRYNNSV